MSRIVIEIDDENGCVTAQVHTETKPGDSQLVTTIAKGTGDFLARDVLPKALALAVSATKKMMDDHQNGETDEHSTTH